MTRAVETFEGYYSLHVTYRVNRAAWRFADKKERKEALASLEEFIGKLEGSEANKRSSFAFYAVPGDKGDMLFWFLEPTLDAIVERERAFDRLPVAEYLEKTYSFVSVIEVSNHAGQDMTHPSVRERLYPTLPKSNYICFYPMSKKRDGADNWYMLESAERAALMRTHGETGRKYEGLIKQFITGACGFDDWEWGVTLFADDALQFKKIVYDMRFDEVSARFGLFGPFIVGVRMTDGVLDGLLPKK